MHVVSRARWCCVFSLIKLDGDSCAFYCRLRASGHFLPPLHLDSHIPRLGGRGGNDRHHKFLLLPLQSEVTQNQPSSPIWRRRGRRNRRWLKSNFFALWGSVRRSTTFIISLYIFNIAKCKYIIISIMFLNKKRRKK
jgi:hypothetical protein